LYTTPASALASTSATSAVTTIKMVVLVAM
jgi:hypothetical protein